MLLQLQDMELKVCLFVLSVLSVSSLILVYLAIQENTSQNFLRNLWELKNNHNKIADRFSWPFSIANCNVKTLCDSSTPLYEKTPCETMLDKHKFQCSHLITVRRKPSRTGNQMFQVAAIIGVAVRHGYTPIIPPSMPLAQIFDLPNLVNIDFNKSSIFSQIGSATYMKSIEHLDHSQNWTLVGFFQSWKYFKDVNHLVRKVFTFKENYTSEASKFLAHVSEEGYQNICIHIRIFGEGVRKSGYAIVEPGYVYRAVDYFNQMFGKNKFILLSNSMNWVKENIKLANATFSPFENAGMDLALMANCNHVIMTSGTFGWWGAWLSGGTVIYWLGYPEKGSKLASRFNATDYYPKNWIGMN